MENRVALRARKEKTVSVDDNRIALCLNIRFAEGIDDPSLHPFVLRRLYYVVYWVEPGEEFHTRIANGLLDPIWNEDSVISLGKNVDHNAFLNLEVMRWDPKAVLGTSAGSVLVGRAKIPLPKALHLVKTKSFGLVRLHGEGHKAEGRIVLSMELKKFTF